MSFLVKGTPRTLGAFLSALFCASVVWGQSRDEYGDIRQTVARISFIQGTASFSRGDDPKNWQPADRNVPMTTGDRVYTGRRSRMELQAQGGDFIRVGSQTDLAALNLTDETSQFSVLAGVASFQVRRLDDGEAFEVDTPNAAVTFERPGDYRVDVDRDGNTSVSVRRGKATVAAGGGQVPLDSGNKIEIDGLDSPRYDVASLFEPDGWDRWVMEREGRLARARSYQYVSDDIAGVDDLDEYGRWRQIPDYGWAWAPAAVSVGWAPYRLGHWIWQDPWGWTWVSAEPWGWAPYHYGRWVTWSSGWYWVPVAPRVRVVAYSPALVAFVGGGPGWSASVRVGGGFVGWFPLAPADPFVPWWGRRSSSVNVISVTYVNRTYVTVVNQNTFVSGGVVTGNIVRDRVVLREVSAAPVARGPLPVVPTAASLRAAVRPGLPPAPRPPAAILARSVVARIAPPPAPPTFQQKLAVIRENRGAPVGPAAAARISAEDRGRARPVSAVRPVAEPGRMTLAPRGEPRASTARPEPVAPARGRPMATAESPAAASPGPGNRAERATAREGAAQPSASGRAPATPHAERPATQGNASGTRGPESRRERAGQGTSSQPPSSETRGRQAGPPERNRGRTQPAVESPRGGTRNQQARPPERDHQKPQRETKQKEKKKPEKKPDRDENKGL